MYNKRIAELNSQPVITSNGSLKLVGVPGATGSTAYYQALNVIGLNPGDIVMEKIGWHSNSQLIGANGKASIYPGQMSLEAGNNLSDYYDITGVAESNGTITLTNAASDQYGNSYDLHITFANSGTPSTGNSNDPTNLVIGPDGNDGSIQFDAYGGFHLSDANFSDVYFTRHGQNTAVNVTVISTFGDLDSGQFIRTTLGNALSWEPDGSEVTNAGGGYYAGPTESTDGYSSTPKGTFLVVGQGSHFSYSFGWQPSDNENSMYHYVHTTADPFSAYTGGEGHQETGYQFNLFGPSATTQVVIPPIRKTTSTSYYNDVTHAKK